MKLVELQERKELEKENKIKAVVESVLSENDNNEIETLIAVYKRKNGRLGVITTYANGDELVGLLELGKMELIEEMYTDE